LWPSFVNGFIFLLQYLYQVTVTLGVPSYGLAIIMFTILLKLVLFPLTVTQMRSMRAMQELQPKIKAIQDRYKDKPEKSQEAVMKLYKEAGANPFAGCLPLLVQMPILFALFSALRIAFNPASSNKIINMSHAGFLWIKNLGYADAPNISIKLATGGVQVIHNGLYILPVLTVIATFGQQYVISMTSTGKLDPNQKTMLYTMPLFIGYLASMYPAGLALYWVVFSVVGIIEQLIIKRMVTAGKVQEKPSSIEPAIIEPAIIEPAIMEPAIIEPAIAEEVNVVKPQKRRPTTRKRKNPA
jgi:YidC/Oxa1 family membrane protein insertase